LIVISAAGAIFWSVQTSVSKRKWYSAKPLLRGPCQSIIWGYANEMQDSVKGWMRVLHCDVWIACSATVRPFVPLLQRLI